MSKMRFLRNRHIIAKCLAILPTSRRAILCFHAHEVASYQKSLLNLQFFSRPRERPLVLMRGAGMCTGACACHFQVPGAGGDFDARSATDRDVIAKWLAILPTPRRSILCFHAHGVASYQKVLLDLQIFAPSRASVGPDARRGDVHWRLCLSLPGARCWWGFGRALRSSCGSKSRVDSFSWACWLITFALAPIRPPIESQSQGAHRVRTWRGKCV